MIILYSSNKVANKTEVIQMSNYTKTNVGNEGRTELHEALS